MSKRVVRLRQEKRGFQLLSKLAPSFSAYSDLNLMFRVVAAAPTIDEMNQQVEAAFDATKPTVLYVECDPDLRLQVRDIFGERYNLFLASDGADGLRKARHYGADAIVIDQMLPRINGREFLLALRDDTNLRSIPVVFLAAQYGVEGRVESLEAGADDCIDRPFLNAELQARVSNLIRARRQERELGELNRRLRCQVRNQLAELARVGEAEQFVQRPVLEALRRSGRAGIAPVRRPVTVLVTELATLAALAERFDEPTLATMADEHFGAVCGICTARGGTIDGLSGASISALFVATEDCSAEQAAWSALQAAFEIRQKMLELAAAARRRGIAEDQLRGIGIASGSCLIGAFGGETLRSYTAIGQAVRNAAELHAVAAHGAIACDHATRSMLASQICASVLDGPHERRGVPGQRYEVTALACEVEPTISMRPTPRTLAAASGGRVFRREGDYWTIAYDEIVLRIRHSKGTGYLGQLLARPQVEIHVCELVQVVERDEPAPRAMSSHEATYLGLRAGVAETAIPRLDPRAKRAYRERLDDLADQLEEARSFGDRERAARAESERTLLARELAAAVGLRGRDRLATATVERFRINVTRSLKALLHKFRQESSELGRHLGASIRTGTFCSYSPSPGAAEVWNVSF